MDFDGQNILPAIRRMKDFEKILESEYEYIVILEIHVLQLTQIAKYAHQKGKKLLIHADLVQGLKNDVYSAEFLCQFIKPAGLISTRVAALKTAKQNGILAIQRLFLLDTIALETSYRLAKKVHPDYIEVLPGSAPHLIQRVINEIDIPIIAGGLITTKEEVSAVLQVGARAITTSRKDLWFD